VTEKSLFLSWWYTLKNISLIEGKILKNKGKPQCLLKFEVFSNKNAYKKFEI